MYPIREILRLFVLPKGRCFAGRCFAGRWARAFHKCVGGGVTICHITAGFRGSNEGSALFLCLPELELEDVFERRFWVRLMPPCFVMPRHYSIHPPMTWPCHLWNKARHTMAGSSESWFWVSLFFRIGGFEQLFLVGAGWRATKRQQKQQMSHSLHQ